MPFATGQELNAADLNLIAAKYMATAVQTSIATGTYTKITVATQVYNYGSSITISGNNTLTIGKTGLYAIGGVGTSQACFGFIGSGSSTAVATRHAAADMYRLDGGLPAFCLSTDALLNQGDTLSMYVWHNHGSNRSTTVTSDVRPYLFARYLGDG
jgi:hypothetical protein